MTLPISPLKPSPQFGSASTSKVKARLQSESGVDRKAGAVLTLSALLILGLGQLIASNPISRKLTAIPPLVPGLAGMAFLRRAQHKVRLAEKLPA